MALLDQVHRMEEQVAQRLRELEPLMREYEELKRVAERLGVTASDGKATATRRAGRRTAGKRRRRLLGPAQLHRRAAARGGRVHADEVAGTPQRQALGSKMYCGWSPSDPASRFRSSGKNSALARPACIRSCVDSRAVARYGRTGGRSGL
jgi:hypothetical protein